MHELPLVFFTVLATSASGTFLFTSKRKSYFDKGNIYKVYLLVISILIISGLGAMTHLGQPLRAPNVILGLGHLSKMSMEILLVSIFGGLLSLLLVINHPLTKKKFCLFSKFEKPLEIATLISALSIIIAIPNVYYLEGVKYWYNGWTWINFFITPLIAGYLISNLTISLFSDSNKNLKTNAVIPGIYMALSLLYTFSIISQLSNIPYEFNSYKFIIIKALLSVILFIFVLLNKKNNLKTNLIMILIIIVSELLGRVFFYELINLRVL